MHFSTVTAGRGSRITLGLAAASIALVALAGCTASGSGGSATTGGSSPSTSHSATASASDALSTASTSLGTVIVDGKGMTVYVFDKDTQNSGTSACTGACITAWPAVTASSAHPSVSGVTGKVGTIPTPNGGHQVTVDGWPLYTYAGDAAKGDVKGQGLQGVWWVVSPSGTKVTSTSSSTSSSGY